MATRTIAKFRAEHEIWRKDLAQTLDVSEEELERLETAGEVPPEIAEKITTSYHLPPDYFTVDFEAAEAEAREAVKALPKSPFRYFFGVSFVWLFVVQALGALVLVPTSIFAMLDFTVAPFFNALEMLCGTVITLVSGIYLSSYIRKKTKFRGDIIHYEFLYPYLSALASAWVMGLFNLLVAEGMDQTAYFYNSMILSIPSAVINLFVGAFYTAALLQTAITEPGEKKDKSLLVLCVIAAASRVLTTVLNGFAYGFADRAVSYYINTTLDFLLMAAVIVGILVGAKKKPNLGKLWFTALPVVAMLLPQLVTAVSSVFSA